MASDAVDKELHTSLLVLPVPKSEDAFEFNQLKLVEKPDSPLNSNCLPDTLEDCEGFLKNLPLKQPNVDQRNPQTIADMINILTDPDATEVFERAIEDQRNQQHKSDECPPPQNNECNIFDYHSSDVMIEQLTTSKEYASHIKLCCNFGWAVRPGCISLYNKDGKTYAVSEGRWMLVPLRGNWIRDCWNINVNQDIIQPVGSQVLIVRVLADEVGLVMEQGTEILLDVGTHVYNSGTVHLRLKHKYADSEFFSHGPYNYVRVQRGKLAKVWAEVTSSSDGMSSLVPRLLKEGEHYIKSILFKYVGSVDASDQYINHGSVHVISVPKGHVAKVFHDQKARLLGEGIHTIESLQFEYVGMDSIISSPCIKHGTITIFKVTKGEVALAWNKNKPLFIDQPGMYEFDSVDFRFVRLDDSAARLICLGSKKIIQVYTGEVGITYKQGELCILDNGRHDIDSNTHTFECFLSTKQRSIRLFTLNANDRMNNQSQQGNEKDKGASCRKTGTLYDESIDFIICETKDLVKIGMRADVFYSITDPEKCIRNIDVAELDDLVRETAVATLTNIIRSTALNQIAQSEHISALDSGKCNLNKEPLGSQELTLATGNEKRSGFKKSEEFKSAHPPVQNKPSAPSAPMFFEKAHDLFMNKLHDDFKQRYGVDIVNIRIESFKIMDSELAYQISKQALTTAQVENELANLDGQSLILTQKERTTAEVQNINATAEASALKTKLDAENQRKIEAAQAEAEALKIARRAKAEAESETIVAKARAEAKAAEAEAEAMKIATKAEADAVLMKADAEAKAISMKAAAESERAQVLSRTELGQQECLLGIYSDMVKQSNSGVEKIVYMDSSVNRQSPFALGCLDNLNRDLHSLSQMGIASKGLECIGEVNQSLDE
mmetsp:Transcript_10612/g.15536  ORF Transcript_10612/g.15536 Transcript_10612/m.15536 type:complete len:894 (-) Transcript_10612:464-3145(-)|eukprot:CAMPEP_0195511932 /NCGR_PEP_ID=MMETSP0794_2-20130614/4078_1 /TAXON_ID=515487 /ORGANISM="Stephanopyxis turris, Strain CCMP 815" /LENGTH=893 /DNA_ID=CAMNT_0040639623 /DNA_START=134 /DNA_END=2815 /DNA_ORIENTATION=+